MKIAVTYEGGMVYQHFGHAEQFKVYEVVDGKVRSVKMLVADGNGHEANAAFLKENGVDVLICGGIGEGAVAALEEAGVGLCAGQSGDADRAVAAYLRGELVSTGANCDHHDHEEEADKEADAEDGADAEAEAGCGGCGGSSRGGCAGCHGCGGPAFEGKNVGKVVRTHYRGTFDDGTQFDSSYDRGEPLEFVCGMGRMIPGFDKAVANMEPGETVQVHLMPDEAYGEKDPSAIFSVDIAQLPGAADVAVGDMVYLQDAYGRQFPVRVCAKDLTTITFDANHEMAGKALNFTIELVEVEDVD